ncbi:MAG: 23S rRNA (pseudouridine(1915)-N(3))-methyltransferase RlmH [Bacilli bacterium]
MIKILCVGKIKEKYLQDLINDYLNRINKYYKIEIIELKENIDIEKENKNILEHIKSNEFNIALDIKGEKYTSEKFAYLVEKTFLINSNITFIIGGSLGLNDIVKNKCDKIISFSGFTFPHGLFRGILLEQIYRSFKIINNETYHK